MPGRKNFYLLSVLPALGPFGSPPPLGKRELLGLVTEAQGPVDLVQTLLLADDLLQREAVLAGEIEPDVSDAAVLSADQMRAESGLPDFLLPAEGSAAGEPAERISGDPVWERYFRHACSVARAAGSGFLAAWVGFEVGLRNAIVDARAQALALEAQSYRVAPELADAEIAFDAALAAWAAAADPLAALEALDRTRWDRLEELRPWYDFSDDEVAAYTAELMLLVRWQRILAPT